MDKPIEDYGVIGDLHTVALVSIDASIDWLCLPRFDSPSVFARLLDHDKGGHFQISPVGDGFKTKQLYWPETNVLITRFLSAEGVGEVLDFMPVGLSVEDPRRHQVVRQVRAIRGEVHFSVDCQPAFNYARDSHQTTIEEHGARFESGTLRLGLRSARPLTHSGTAATGTFALREGEATAFVLGVLSAGATCQSLIAEEEAHSLREATVAYWRRWLSQSTYGGRWREMVNRSALVLKLLTFEPTGAIVAAPTTSLPEGLGGLRNWDYRYTWIRDAAFTVYAFMRIGFTEEARRFMDFIEDRAREHGADGKLQIMYGIDGRHDLEEETLDHLAGYAGSRPVRVGNAAHEQLQLDIYGELLDSVYLYNKYGTPVSHELWGHLRRIVDWVCDHWRLPDEGIWENRGGQQHFVFSKLMCWVALDRALRLADKRSFPADRTRWLKERDEIYTEIMENGWSETRGAFVRAYGSDSLDASNLMMPLVLFTSPSDPRVLRMLDATLEPPERGGLVSNSLVYRYNVKTTPDGLTGEEGTFNMCTFWLVEALTRAGRSDPRRLERARLTFEEMLGYANHLGLYAEQTGHNGEALGNYPQAFTHLSLISSAFNLDRALNERRRDR